MKQKQTAVQWLLERICNDILDDDYINKLSIEKTQLFNKISAQAKQMEKEQVEISDEEIESFIFKYYGEMHDGYYDKIIDSMKLYRELLKQKQ